MPGVNIGSEGFKWFLGVVIDNVDPLKLGRVKVKVFQEHDSKIEDDDLHWATIMMSATSASLRTPSGATVGTSPTGILIGSYCMGFYMDTLQKQYPVIMGTWHKMPDLNPNKSDVTPLATGKQVLHKAATGPEPASAYAALYPYNKVHHTLSGHAIEIDDTPGAERLHVYHKSGTYVEINNTGQRVTKVVVNDIEVIATDQTIYIGGNQNIEIVGDQTVKIGGNQKIDVGGNIDVTAGGNINITAGGNVKIKGSRIDLN